jgi:Tfp pilus assembly protein PilF
VFDHVLNLGAVFLLLAVAIATVAQPTARSDFERKPAALIRIAGLAGAAMCIGMTAWFVRADRAAIQAAHGAQIADTGDWSAAAALWTDAANTDPGDLLTQVELAIVAARTGQPDARDRMRAIVARDGLAMHLVSLAYLELDAGNQTAALERASDALARDPGDENVGLNVGWIAEAAGDRDLAAAGYAHAVAMDPELASSTYWVDPARTLTRDHVVDRALTIVSPSDRFQRALIQAFAGRPAVSAGLSAEELERLDAVVVLVTRGPQAALDPVVAMANAHPLDPFGVRWAQRLSASAGRATEAERYGRWLETLGAEGAASSPRHGSVVVAAESAASSPIPPNYPWALYGRRGPRLLVVPGTLIVDPWAVSDQQTP